MFLRQIDGGPAIIIDGGNCPNLVQALKFHYRYRRKQNNNLDETPEKSHPWSDLADCLQYMCLGATGSYLAGVIDSERPRPRGPRPSVASWT